MRESIYGIIKALLMFIFFPMLIVVLVSVLVVRILIAIRYISFSKSASIVDKYIDNVRLKLKKLDAKIDAMEDGDVIEIKI